MKKLYFLLVCILTSALSLTSCEDLLEPYTGHEIVSSWKNVSIISDPLNPFITEVRTSVVSFYPTGYYHADIETQYSSFPAERTTEDGKFTINGNVLTMLYHQGGKDVSEVNYYVISGNQMKITSIVNPLFSIVFTRVW